MPGMSRTGKDHRDIPLISSSKGPAKSPWPMMRGQNARHTGRQPKPSGK